MFRFGHKNSDKTVEVTVSNSTVFRVLAIIIVAGLLVAALRQAAHSITLIFIAFFLALALNSPVHWLSERLPGKRRGSRKLATGLSFLIIILLLVGFLASITPPIVRQTSTFIDNAPSIIEDARSENGSLGNFIRRYQLQDEVDKLSSEVKDRLGNVGSTAISGVGKVGSSIFSTLTVLVLTFMMLIEGPRWIAFAKRLMPDEHEKHLTDMGADMYKVVTGFVNGQVTLAALAAVMILLAMLALGISYPIALMVIVFICGLIPLVGHPIGATIVTTVALFHSPWTAVIILAYYILYQQIENYVLQPKIQANSTNMSPLLVFAAVIIGVSFGGIFWGLVAIPLAGCLRIVVLDYLTNRGILTKSEKNSLTSSKTIPDLYK